MDVGARPNPRLPFELDALVRSNIMPVVFVHGVPDTQRVWRPVLQRVNRNDAVALSLPGFGTVLPPNFRATKEEYLAWLAATLERMSQPIDLVGHDWGSLLVVRIASTRPDLIRSWAGGGAPVSCNYQWHSMARLWQKPGVGEQVMAGTNAAAAHKSLVEQGVPEALAAETASHIDPTMKDCILRLYRSATDVFKEWEPGLANIRASGLVLWGENDPYAGPEFAEQMGEQTGARRVVRIKDCGHWWPCQKPDEVAAELLRHWRDADGSTSSLAAMC
jgi:pimeloyl-ACP methyl ester carboxylesterase